MQAISLRGLTHGKGRSVLKRNVAVALLLALGPAVPALAQPAGNVAQINNQSPKPGMSDAYEAARKKHMGWHKAQKDTWSWLTWEVVSGEASGSYLTGTFGRAWKDFDGREKFEAQDSADVKKTVGPTLGHIFTSYYVRRVDMSLTPPSADPPSAFSLLTYFRVRPEGMVDFVEAVKKVNEGIKKTSYPQSGPSTWYQLVNGGEGPLYVLAAGRANWAAFAPNDKTLDQMMEDAYGKVEGPAILASLRKAVVFTRTETLKYRPDLSYIAPK